MSTRSGLRVVEPVEYLEAERVVDVWIVGIYVYIVDFLDREEVSMWVVGATGHVVASGDEIAFFDLKSGEIRGKHSFLRIHWCLLSVRLLQERKHPGSRRDLRDAMVPI